MIFMFLIAIEVIRVVTHLTEEISECHLKCRVKEGIYNRVEATVEVMKPFNCRCKRLNPINFNATSSAICIEQ